MNAFVIFLIFFSAGLAVGGKYSRIHVHYVFKPLTMTLIILLAIFTGTGVSTAYKYLILMALIFSLGGDVFIMLNRENPIKGLAAFLIAHVFYVSAFLQGIESFYPLILIPVLVFAAIFFLNIHKGLKKLFIPVLSYTIVLSLMGYLAANRYVNVQDEKSLLALIGASFFLVSESSWAVNRFKKSFAWAEVLILGTYFSAQTLLALSV
jgi:uncharacterized membrane protein YhhN